MKKLRKTTLFATFAVAGAFFGIFFPALPVASSSTVAPDPKTIVVTLLGGAQREERGDISMKFNVNDLTGVSYKSRHVRHRAFAIIDRTHMSKVSCNAREAEFGSVKLKDGSWIAVAVCPETPTEARIAIPSLIRARAAANEAALEEMTCWESTELRMGVCFKAGSNPASGPMPQTREHILLARQVG